MGRAFGAPGNGELVAGSDRGAENGEGDKSDGRAVPAPEGRGLVAVGELVDGNGLLVETFGDNGVGEEDPLGSVAPESAGEPPSAGKLGAVPNPGGSARAAG